MRCVCEIVCRVSGETADLAAILAPITSHNFWFGPPGSASPGACRGARKRPGLSMGGAITASASSFAVGSARKQVNLSSALKTGMTEPKGDLADVLRRLKYVNCTGVAQHMRK